MDDQNAAGQTSIQGYDTRNNDWESISVSGGSFNRKWMSELLIHCHDSDCNPCSEYNRYWSMHASSFEGGGTLSFLAGGADYVSGMVIFNASNPLQPTWQNVTNDNAPYFYAATTQYVRFGDAGVLISVGGFVTESTSDGVAQRREMNSVQVYDIANDKWSTVFATGDTPPPRSRMCSALSAAPDDSSFQMVMHGGWDETNPLGDVYVLTMPAFHWIKMNTTGGNSVDNPRMDHFCSSHQDRSMLVVGGKSQLDANTSNINCTDGYSAVRLLDTTTFQWQDQYPLADTTYQVPQAVIDVIGGSPTGGAKTASAFSQTLGDNLAIFSKTIPHYDPDHPPQNAPKAASSTGPTSSPSSSSSSGTSSGTIAGAAVGGVVGAAVLLGAAGLFYFRRRRQNRNRQPSGQYQDSQELDPGTRYSYLHEMGGDTQMKPPPVQLHGTETGMFKDRPPLYEPQPLVEMGDGQGVGERGERRTEHEVE